MKDISATEITSVPESTKYEYYSSLLSEWSQSVSSRGIMGMFNVPFNLQPNNPDNEIENKILHRSNPYKTSSEKKIWIVSWLKYIPKDTRGYASIKLLSDLQTSIQKQSQKLEKLFPSRIKRFKLPHLYEVTGLSDNILRMSRSHRYTIEKSLDYLDIIETSLKNKYNSKDIELSLTLIDSYRAGPQNKEFYKNILDGIQLNLGKISGLIRLNYRELSLILKKGTNTESEGFVHDIIQWIIHHNNEYSLSLEEVEDYKEILSGWLFNDAKECLDIINSYIQKNPNIDKYNKQNTRIPNEKLNYFKDLIESPELLSSTEISKQEFEGLVSKMFFFGFICADGYVTNSRIGMELTWNDRNILYKLADGLGLPASSVKSRERPFTYKGETKWYKSAFLRWQAKGMVQDIKDLGKTGLKHDFRLPAVIRELITLSKEMELKNLKGSSLPMLLAKAWLFGFFNGDGSLGSPENKNWIAPMIVAASKSLLEEIAIEFGLDFSPRVVHNPGDLLLVFDRQFISKGLYALNLGADFYRLMVNELSIFTREYDLPRKRMNIGNDNLLKDR